MLNRMLLTVLITLAMPLGGCTEIVHFYIVNTSDREARLVVTPPGDRILLKADQRLHLKGTAKRALLVEQSGAVYEQSGAVYALNASAAFEGGVPREDNFLSDAIYLIIDDDGRIHWATPSLEPIGELDQAQFHPWPR